MNWICATDNNFWWTHTTYYQITWAIQITRHSHSKERKNEPTFWKYDISDIIFCENDSCCCLCNNDPIRPWLWNMPERYAIVTNTSVCPGLNAELKFGIKIFHKVWIVMFHNFPLGVSSTNSVLAHKSEQSAVGSKAIFQKYCHYIKHRGWIINWTL